MIVSGRLFVARLKRLGVRCVPFAASRYALLSVSFGVNRHSGLIFQRRSGEGFGPGPTSAEPGIDLRFAKIDSHYWIHSAITSCLAMFLTL
jgi:hypothetical protein